MTYSYGIFVVMNSLSGYKLFMFCKIMSIVLVCYVNTLTYKLKLITKRIVQNRNSDCTISVYCLGKIQIENVTANTNSL